jgi:YaiO family outer membrane protein
VKKSLIAAALFSLTAAASFAGTIEMGATSSHLGGGYPQANSQSIGVVSDIGGDSAVSLTAQRLHNWGQTAMVYEAGVTHRVGNGIGLTLTAGGSDSGVIAPQDKIGLMGTMPVPGVNGLSAGLGYEHIDMRGGFDKTDTLKTQLSYSVPGAPVLLSAGADMQRVGNDHDGMVYRLSAVYGEQGKWTAGVSAKTGVSDYTVVFPGAKVGSYRSTVAAVNGRYWVQPNWGLTATASRTKNDFFTDNQVGVGAFATF